MITKEQLNDWRRLAALADKSHKWEMSMAIIVQSLMDEIAQLHEENARLERELSK